MNDGLYIYLVGPVPCGYDEYDSFVITAASPDQARRFAGETASDQREAFLKAPVEEIGIANPDQKPGIDLASFNAG